MVEINLKEFIWYTNIRYHKTKSDKGIKMSTITVKVIDKTNQNIEKLIVEGFFKKEDLKLEEEKYILKVIKKLYGRRT